VGHHRESGTRLGRAAWARRGVCRCPRSPTLTPSANVSGTSRLPSMTLIAACPGSRPYVAALATHYAKGETGVGPRVRPSATTLARLARARVAWPDRAGSQRRHAVGTRERRSVAPWWFAADGRRPIAVREQRLHRLPRRGECCSTSPIRAWCSMRSSEWYDRVVSSPCFEPDHTTFRVDSDLIPDGTIPGRFCQRPTPEDRGLT